MKNLILCMFIFVSGIFCLLTITSISGRSVRNMEVKRNMDNALESTVKIAKEEENYKINGEKEMLADFVENMVATVKSDSDLKVNVWNVDAEKGLLGIGVVEMFRYPNGREGQIEDNRIVLWEEVQKQGTNSCKVNFYINKEDMLNEAECYKTLIVTEGQKIQEPVCPKVKGKVFGGWLDANDYVADFSQGVQEDITYYGEWK